MSRRHSAEKREVLPDPKFGNIIITKFMNSVMYAGKKSVAEGIVYGALGLIETKTKQNPLGVFEQALENVIVGRLIPAGTGLAYHRIRKKQAAGTDMGEAIEPAAEIPAESHEQVA